MSENAEPVASSGIPSTEELFVGPARKKRLNQWLATGICGNDITSSCLYVSAIAAVYAGVLAPLVLLMVIFVLYLYKKVYTDVVEALPLNGGTYNCLLNCTSKLAAALAACMTILSYIATALISSKTAVDYAYSLYPHFSVTRGTILVLAVFATLAIIGITDTRVILFTRAAGLERLHTAFSYIVKNESSRSVVVIHLFSNPEYNEEESLKKSLETIGEIFPVFKLQMIVRPGKFGPEIIEEVSKEFDVAVNNIFIGAPEEKHTFSVQELGGVRVIF